MKKPPQFISHNVYCKTKKITRHNKEKKQSIATYYKMIQLLLLADKNFEAIIRNMLKS